MFVDEARLHIKQATGEGCVLSGAKIHPKGGPDAGTGATAGLLRRRPPPDPSSTSPPAHGKPARQAGGKEDVRKGGADLLVPVPRALLFLTRTYVLLADLDAPGTAVRRAKGGRAGAALNFRSPPTSPALRRARHEGRAQPARWS